MARNDELWEAVDEALDEVAAYAAAFVGGAAIGMAVVETLLDSGQKAIGTREINIDDD